MKVDFVTLDVFTATIFGGNPLAVVTDARGLDDAAMQAIAAEFGYSESTFVLPSDDPSCAARVRIFTPTHELPFAGHPNVGTAVALARAGEALGAPVGDRLRFEEGIGVVEIDIAREDGVPVGARFAAPGRAELGCMFEEEAIAECAGLARGDIRIDNHLPRVVGLGVSFAFAEVADASVLARCQPAPARFAIHLPLGVAEGLYLYAREGDGPDTRVRARLFAPLGGIPEDPATGSAAAMLGALVGGLAGGTGDLSIAIEQGVEMGRPSRIDVGVERSAAGVESVTVGGRAVPVMAGTIALQGAGAAS